MTLLHISVFAGVLPLHVLLADLGNPITPAPSFSDLRALSCSMRDA